MSSASKTKRGEAGVSNAKNIAFRYGGSPCNYSIAIGNPNSKYGAGTLLVRAMCLAIALPGFAPSEKLLRQTDAAMNRCTAKELI